MRLAALDTAHSISDVDLPGFRLHKLLGDRSNLWSIALDGNWRLTFEFRENNVYVLNYEDYH